MEYVEDFFTHGVKAFTTPRVPKDHYIRIEAKGRVKKVAVSAEHPLQEVKVGQRAVMSFLVRACRGTKRILRPCAHKPSRRPRVRAEALADHEDAVVRPKRAHGASTARNFEVCDVGSCLDIDHPEFSCLEPRSQ